MWCNLNHPQYSFDSEVLSMVPCAPGFAGLQDMKRDFCLRSQALIERALVRLQRNGHPEIAIVRMKGIGYVTFVRPDGWAQLKAAANRYWHAVRKDGGSRLKVGRSEPSTFQP